MADFTRTSRIVGVNELDPPLLGAIKAALDRNELGIVLLDVVKACRTESVPTKRRSWLFGPKRRPHTTVVVLTPTWLVWATDASGTPSASLCRLTDADVRRHAAPGSDDTGLDVTGLLDPTASQRSTAFVPLDMGVGGNEFARLAIETAAAARG